MNRSERGDLDRWRRMALKRALRPGGRSTSLIKGDAASEPAPGLVPAYSASGQDVWLEDPLYSGPGLVISAVGARCGKVFEARDEWGVVANTAVLIPQPGHDPHFLWYLTNDEGFWEKGGTAQPYVRVPETLDRRVALPPLDQQRAIARFLDIETARIDALITKKRRMIALLDERHLSLIFRGVTGADLPGPRRPSGVDWIRTVPAHWGVPWVGANYTSQLGKMLNAEAAAGPDQYPYVRNTNVQWDRLDFTDLAEMHFDPNDRVRCELRVGDLLVCEGGEVGRAAVWPGHSENVYFQKAIHRVRPVRQGNTRFLMYCLRAAAHLNVFAVEGNQSTIVHLTGEKLREHRLPFPPLEEQERLVRELDTHHRYTRTVVERLTQQIALLQEHRQALITAAVTGEFEFPGVAA